jgi:hypothetical protein
MPDVAGVQSFIGNIQHPVIVRHHACHVPVPSNAIPWLFRFLDALLDRLATSFELFFTFFPVVLSASSVVFASLLGSVVGVLRSFLRLFLCGLSRILGGDQQQAKTFRLHRNTPGLQNWLVA